MSEAIPDDWVRVVVLISPNGQEVVAIGGDYQPPADKPCPNFPKNWERLQANLAALRRVGDLDDPYPKLLGEGPHPTTRAHDMEVPSDAELVAMQERGELPPDTELASQPTARMVKFSDVLEIVSGVAPPDSYYYKGDTRGIQAWQSAIGRVQVELERYLSVQGETDDE